MGLVCFYFLLVAVGGRATWERLRVPVEQPSFLDMRSLTTAWECDRRGIDVLPSNPCDPRDRPANYPRLWLLPASLGLGEEATVPLAVAMALAFFVAALAVTGPLTLRDGLLYGLALCSPAVMLGVERGNPDLFIFVLLAGALLAFRRGTALRVLSHGLFLLAALLKLFPVFAWGVLSRQSRRSAVLGGSLLVGVFACYLALTFDYIRTILEVVPQEIVFSYGAGVFADGLVQELNVKAEHAGSILTVAIAVAGVLVAISVGLRWRRSAVRDWAPALDAFWVGAGIYVGSYAVFHNYDYRLSFLLLTLPQLARWSSGTASRVPLASFGLLGTLLVMGLAARPDYGLAADEVVNWLLFVYLAAALVATAALPPASRRSR